MTEAWAVSLVSKWDKTNNELPHRALTCFTVVKMTKFTIPTRLPLSYCRSHACMPMWPDIWCYRWIDIGKQERQRRGDWLQEQIPAFIKHLLGTLSTITSKKSDYSDATEHIISHKCYFLLCWLTVQTLEQNVELHKDTGKQVAESISYFTNLEWLKDMWITELKNWFKDK